MCEPWRASFRRMVAGISIAASVSRNSCKAVWLRSSIGLWTTREAALLSPARAGLGGFGFNAVQNGAQTEVCATKCLHARQRDGLSGAHEKCDLSQLQHFRIHNRGRPL